LKPTRGRVSQGPLAGESWAGGVADGAVTRTVRDAAGLLDAISGRMPGEPYYAPPLPRPLTEEAGADPGQLRIGVLDRPGAEGYLDDPECRAAVAGAALLLEALGHDIEPGLVRDMGPGDGELVGVPRPAGDADPGRSPARAGLVHRGRS